VQAITPGDPAADANGLKRLKGEVAQAMAQDIDVQFLGALRARSDVRLNPRMLETLAQP
jgi:peptidyl-prolyl cis-trans isomerase D